jgi:hypothetical protein
MSSVVISCAFSFHVFLIQNPTGDPPQNLALHASVAVATSAMDAAIACFNIE